MVNLAQGKLQNTPKNQHVLDMWMVLLRHTKNDPSQIVWMLIGSRSMEMGVHNSHMHGDCKLPIQALEIALLGVVYFLQQTFDTSM